MSRKKKQQTVERKSTRGALDARLGDLSEKRAVRRREPGDGKGVDVGIAPGAFSGSIESHLKGLKPETRERLRKHVVEHVDAAMKPLKKLVASKGTSTDAALLADVGPNALRTIIEFLEEKPQTKT